MTERALDEVPGPGRVATLGVASALTALIAVFWLLRMLGAGASIDLPTSDLYLYYLPAYETLYGALRGGALPLWNPYQLCGIPGLASLQAGFFYPGHVLYLVLPVFTAFAVSSVAHLVLLAVATLALARRVGLATTAGFAAAVLLALRGRYPQMVVFPNMLEAAAWLPVGGLAVASLARGGGRRAAAGVAVALGMSLLAGYPQLAVYVVYSWGALLALLLATARADLGRWLRAAAFFALGLALGALAAGVQLAPGLELAAEGTRSPGPLSRWQQFPFGWYGPGLVDALTQTLRSKLPVLPLSLGAVSLVLLPLAAVPRRLRVLGVGGVAVALVVVLFAMGPATPFFDWIVELPALGWFRFPRRALFMADFFVALALGVAWHVAARVAAPPEDASRAPRVALSACGIAAALVVALGAPDDSFVPALRFAPAFFALAAVAVLALPRVAGAARFAARVPVALVALMTLELLLAEIDRPLAWSPPTSLERYHRDRPMYETIRATRDRVWLRSLGIEPALPPKLATYARLRSVGDYEPLNLRRQAEYFTYLMEGALTPARQGRPYSGRLKHLTAPTYPGAIDARGRLLDVAAVRWLVVSQKAAERGELANHVAARGLVPIEESEHLVLLENPHAVPRAYVVYDVESAPESLELLRRMSDPAFDPLATSYAEGVDARAVDGAPPRGHAAEIVVDDATQVEVAATLDAPGMLVLADSYYPGWRATVDGRALEIHAANHLFRGVRLPAGEHVVRFEYVPTTLWVGAGTSVVALVAIAIVAFGPGAFGPGALRLPRPVRGDSIREAADDPGRDET